METMPPHEEHSSDVSILNLDFILWTRKTPAVLAIRIHFSYLVKIDYLWNNTCISTLSGYDVSSNDICIVVVEA